MGTNEQLTFAIRSDTSPQFNLVGWGDFFVFFFNFSVVRNTLGKASFFR